MKDQNNTQKHVYICSPLRPVSTGPILRANELIDNLKLAKDACTFAALRSCDPVAPHLFYPQFLDDNDPTERALGMELGIRALRACDELWIISPRISSGMSAEIREAQKCGIPVLVFTAAGFRKYTGNGDMTDNCYADTADSVIEDNSAKKEPITLRELFAAVDAHKSKNVTEKTVLASYDDGELKMDVYSDGTVAARKHNRRTSFKLANCTDYTYHSAVVEDGGATPTHIDAETFLDEKWKFRLVLEAEDRLWKNKNGHERSNSWRF